MKTIDERKEEGKAYRKITSRRELSIWEVQTKRSDVVKLIREQEKTRTKELLPILHVRLDAGTRACKNPRSTCNRRLSR